MKDGYGNRNGTNGEYKRKVKSTHKGSKKK